MALIPQHPTPRFQLLLQPVRPFLRLAFQLRRQQLVMFPSLRRAALAVGGLGPRQPERIAHLLHFLGALLEFFDDRLDFERGVVRVTASSHEGVEFGEVRVEELEQGLGILDERQGVAVVMAIVVRTPRCLVELQFRGAYVGHPFGKGAGVTTGGVISVVPAAAAQLGFLLLSLSMLLSNLQGGASGGEEFAASAHGVGFP
mmetsp:Transcript_34452/g.58413  ORF Transcript_34452/g.58413 Transcript_34452/m.58413 type:complete len:201 (+) Transcript_34452:269-871(+)